MGRMIARRRIALAVAGALVLTTACRKNPAGDGPYASEVAQAVPRIEKATGLKYKRPPRVEVRSKEQVRYSLLK